MCSTNAQRVGAADILSNLKRIFTVEYNYFTKEFVCQVMTWLFKLKMKGDFMTYVGKGLYILAYSMMEESYYE